MLVFHDGAGGCVSGVFVLNDARRTCSRGVIGSTMGVYPRGTGLNPARGMGTFFPHAVGSIFRLSLTRLFQLSRGPCRRLVAVAVPEIAVGVFHNACLCFTMELVGDCLKCLFRLMRGVLALVV